VNEQTNFIGRGISFPMRIDHTGGFAMSTGADDIDSSMRMVLCTAPGERLMRPEFGCRIWELLFEPINANTLGLMAEYVRLALAQWEPRATVDDVAVRPRESDEGAVDIAITYSIRSTNDQRNLVYPFYLIPGDDEQ
jgi:Bacteriophage baseplate protein W